MTRTPFAPAQAAELALYPSQTVPEQPTLFRPAGSEPEAFGTLDQLAQRLHELADGFPGLDVAEHQARCTFIGNDTFTAWSVYRVDADGGRQWIASAAIQERSRDLLQAAILRTRP